MGAIRSAVATIWLAYDADMAMANQQFSRPTQTRRPYHRRARLKETAVPIIRIEMFPGRTLAQKRELVRLITDAVCNVAHTDPKNTHVIFEEHSVEDWAWDGKLYVDQEDDEA